MRKLVFSLIAILFTGMISAQNVQISGTVTDADDGEPMIGVSVAVLGTTTGTATDVNGRYTIAVPSTAELTFSFMGYVSQTIPVSGNKVINVALESDSKVIDEVMVVAYGTATKSAFTGSAAVVKSDAIEAHVATSATSALSGTTPGVQFISSNGDPTSGGQTIRIRGYGSMSASSAPLYIVDGMPYDGSISDINPNDIESMSVLKDASASAIYGARGANGVIIITTKKAGGNVPNVKLDARWGSNSRQVPYYDVISDPAQYYEMIFANLYNTQLRSGASEDDAYAKACSQLFDRNNGGVGYQVYTLPQGQQLIGKDGKLNPYATLGYTDGEYYYQPDNWYDEVFHNSFRQEYNLSVSANKDKLNYYASLGLLDDGGMVDNSGFKRYTARINAEYQPKEWMKVTTNISYSHSTSQQPSYDADTYGSSGSVFYITQTMAPIYPLYVRNYDGSLRLDNGRPVYDANQTNFKRASGTGNAVRDNYYNRYNGLSDVINGNLGLTLTPIKGLSLSANLGVFNDNTRSNELYSQFASYSSVDGAAYVSHSRTFGITTQLLANYKKEFGKNTVDFLVGWERYKRTTNSLSGYNDHLFDPFIGELGNAHGKSSMTTSSSTNNYMTQGIIGRLQYDYDGKYFISGSYRRDQSSRFAEGHRWGGFGSIGGAWLISKEDFLSDVSWIDMLKIKASYGVQGNDNLGSNFPYSDQYSIKYNEETGEYSLNLAYKGNPDLTWETSHAFNVGFEFGFFNGYLNGSIEYYSRKTSDLLYDKDVPLSSGNPLQSYPINIGSIRNSGIEAALDGIIIHNKRVNWDWNFNISTNKNKILELDPSIPEEGIKGSYSIQKVGGSVHEAYMIEFAGLDENGHALYYKDVLDKEGNVVDYEKIDDPTKATKHDLGAVYPKVYGGFGTSISFYGFDASIQFSYQLGGKYYDGSYQQLMWTQNQTGNAMHADLLNAWTRENTDTDIPAMDGTYILGQTACDRFLTSSNYLALNNAQIGYTIPARLVKKMHLGTVRVYVAGENLFLVSARKGLDPRNGTGLGGFSSGGGLDSGRYGAMRNITGGVTVTF